MGAAGSQNDVVKSEQMIPVQVGVTVTSLSALQAARVVSKNALFPHNIWFGSPLTPSAYVCLVMRCQPAQASLQELQTPVFHMLAPPAYLRPKQTANCCADVIFQAGMRL